jgi:hypothetical protein
MLKFRATTNAILNEITLNGALMLVSPQAREYITKLTFAAIITLSCGMFIQVFDIYPDFETRYSSILLISSAITLALIGLRWLLGPMAFFADIKWLLLFDNFFILMVFVAYNINSAPTKWLFNAVRLYIDVEGNLIFALSAVRLLWCFRDKNGAFLRMPPLSAPRYIIQTVLQRKFSPTVLLAGVVASSGVGALTWAIFAFVYPMAHAAAYIPAVFILAAGAFPCGVGIVRALIAKELERRASAQAAAAAQAETAAKELARAEEERKRHEEERKRHEAEQATQAAVAEMHHTQRLFKGFAQRTMRLQDERDSAVVVAQRAEKQLPASLAAIARGRAELKQTRAELRQSRAELALKQIELQQVTTDLRRTTAELHRTRTELNQEVQALQQKAVALHEALLERGKHVFAWGLESIGPTDKVSAEEVRTAIAALNPDSPTYAMGLKIAVRVLMLVQAAPKEKKSPTIKAAEYHYTKVLAEFMVKTGMVNQYKKPNLLLIKSAVRVALARPGNKEEEDEE